MSRSLILWSTPTIPSRFKTSKDDSLVLNLYTPKTFSLPSYFHPARHFQHAFAASLFYPDASTPFRRPEGKQMLKRTKKKEEREGRGPDAIQQDLVSPTKRSYQGASSCQDLYAGIRSVRYSVHISVGAQ